MRGGKAIQADLGSRSDPLFPSSWRVAWACWHHRLFQNSNAKAADRCPPYTHRDQPPKSDGELGCPPSRMRPAGDAQGSVDWLHNLRIHFYTRIRGAKFIVKNLAHRRCVTKDTSDPRS